MSDSRDRDAIEGRVRLYANVIRPPAGIIECPDDFVFTESPLILDGIEGDPTHPLAYRSRETGELATREDLDAAGITHGCGNDECTEEWGPYTQCGACHGNGCDRCMPDRFADDTQISEEQS